MRGGWLVIAAGVAACGIDARGTGAPMPELSIPNDASADASVRDATTTIDGAAALDGGEGGTIGPYASAVLADAPIAYWRLEEAAGPSAADERSTYPATVTSGVFGRTGALVSQPSSAVRFDGADTVISAPAAMPFDGNKPFSIEAWIRPLLQDGAVRWFFTWGDPSTTSTINGALQLYGSAGGLIFVRTAPDGSQTFYLQSSISFGVFTHVVVTYDGNMQRMYKDGVEVKNVSSVVALGGPAGYEVRWGTMMKGNFYKFDGEMDELALYDKALAASRVKAHYDAH